MEVTILDYSSDKVVHEIGELESISTIEMEIQSGDEVLIVHYKDGRVIAFDSCEDRILDFFDGSYIVYNEESGTNILNDEKWLNRKDSYDY